MILGLADTADQKGNCGLFDDGTGRTGYLCGRGKKQKQNWTLTPSTLTTITFK